VSSTSSAPARRGPSGAAPLPPGWLASATLPIQPIPAGTTLYRVHRSTHGSVFFGPGAGNPPTYRFDSLSGTFGVFYVGLGVAGALVETLLRNPARKMVDYTDIDSRALTLVHSDRDLKLVRLHGNGLQQIGCDNAISTGPYDPCGAWSDALRAHRSKPDGIAYQSRHDPGEICLALFERSDLALISDKTTELRDMLSTVANMLSSYAKSISNPPL
jgi:hypothetical protein